MGLLNGLQGFAQRVNGLLYPGFGSAGVDPRAVQAAQSQAMMQMGASLLGGAPAGQAYGVGQAAGWEPIEQGRREAVMRAAAADRQAQADERERKRKMEEAAVARQAQIEAQVRPLIEAGDYEGASKILASNMLVSDAKAVRDLGAKQGVNIEMREGPFGGKIMVGSDGRWQYADPPKGPSVRIDASGGGEGYGKAPSGYRWKPDGTMEPVPGGPFDPTVPQRTTLTPKDASTARQKINQINVARQQLALARQKYEALKDTLSMGPGGQLLPTPKGKEFDAAIDSMRGSITAITRVPGVGAMSDFETRLDQAKFPTRGNYESVAAQQLQSLDDLLSGLEQGYQGMLGFENPAAAPQPETAAPSDKPVRIMGEADYAKLPSGALFIGPDGKTRRKP